MWFGSIYELPSILIKKVNKRTPATDTAWKILLILFFFLQLFFSQTGKAEGTSVLKNQSLKSSDVHIINLPTSEQAKPTPTISYEVVGAEYIPPAPPPAPVYYSLPTDFYKSFIYEHESGNNPTRWNSSGCLGLGQACPASKLLAVCPGMDYACEDAWFTNYANAYGGWYPSYVFWNCIGNCYSPRTHSTILKTATWW